MRYRLIHVDPRQIEWLVVPRLHTRDDVSRYGTHVLGGDWDRNYSEERVAFLGSLEGFEQPTLVRFENYWFYESAEAHFERDVPWEDTKLYRFLVDHREDTGRRYNSETEIRRRLDEFDRLYHHVRENGYLTQRELQASAESPFVATAERPEYHEIWVNVGRDGELLFNEGRHRFVVAKLLGLERVPARVLVRHSEWQRRRRAVADVSSRSELDADTRALLGHPDFQDVLPRSLASAKIDATARPSSSRAGDGRGRKIERDGGPDRPRSPENGDS